MDTNLNKRIRDYDVLDANGNKIGTVDALWADEQTGRLEFIGVKTGWIFGKNHVVPVERAQVDEGQNVVRLPYTEDKVKDAPTIDEDKDIMPAEERRIFAFYSLPAERAGLPERDLERREELGARGGEVDIPLAEEELRVGKREVADDVVRLRKVVRTEPVEKDITLRREDVEIERVPATGRNVPKDAFQEREYEVRTSHEEPVVEKEAHLKDRVKAHRDVETEKTKVRGELRKEDVEVEGREFRDRT